MSKTSEPSEDSSLPKQQRRCDEAPLDSFVPGLLAFSGMDCNNQEPKLPSYKDMLIGTADGVEDDDLISLGDDDIDLLDDDIQTYESDGIPFINFSDRVKDLAVKSMDFTLILKILGRRVGYTTIYNWIIGLWKSSHQIKLIDIENDYYLVKFSLRTDYIHALTKGPWTIFGHYITVEPCLIEAIGAWIGKVVKIDYQTDFEGRGRFARMAVKINLKKPLVSKITINGEIQFVEYESLSMVCFKCGVYGHVSDSCAPTVDGEHENVDHVSPQPQARGSRFNPIFMDDTATADPVDKVTIQLEVATASAESMPTATESPSLPPENVVKSKTKWKATLLLCKPAANVLAPRNQNIMPRKSGLLVGSSSRSKERNAQSPLNPASYGGGGDI
ncbi:hypothetical protein V6N12_016973 [Hibiscus sabdariffa]|uniref:CCHC-type domain-containing protein n=1 Tax=Hibiscus sabdariffa TaxID=183260 RepID=A0ABR2AU50_9ROSI